MWSRIYLLGFWWGPWCSIFSFVCCVLYILLIVNCLLVLFAVFCHGVVRSVSTYKFECILDICLLSFINFSLYVSIILLECVCTLIVNGLYIFWTGIGVTYVRWGRKDCTDGAELVYTGIVECISWKVYFWLFF